MKKSLVLLSMVAVFSLMASFAVADAGVLMRVDVPFDFYLGDQLLPAGEYQVKMDSSYGATASFVIVRSTDGRGIGMLTTQSGDNADRATSQLRFNRYGKKCFLSGVSIDGRKATLKVYKLEKELMSQIDKAGSITVIAQN